MPDESSNYNPIVLAHYRHPRNFGILENASHKRNDLNPLCGDEITIYLQTAGPRIEKMTYEARGCALSIAAASVLSEFVRNKKFPEIKNLRSADMAKLLEIPQTSAARESCLTLALQSLNKLIS
jgi:nitrogen fixation NifU-like protein